MNQSRVLCILFMKDKLYTLKDDDKFRSWMMRIVVNEAKMYIRKNSNIVYMEDMETVVERAKEDWSGKKDVNGISKIMRIPPGTVKSRLSKASRWKRW